MIGRPRAVVQRTTFGLSCAQPVPAVIGAPTSVTRNVLPETRAKLTLFSSPAAAV